MTKQEFLEGKEFKKHPDSMVTYKYGYKAILYKVNDGSFKIDSLVDEIKDDRFIAINSILDELFFKEVKFKNLIFFLNTKSIHQAMVYNGVLFYPIFKEHPFNEFVS